MAAQSQELQKKEAQAVAGAERTRTRTVFSPRADVFETGEAIVVVADLPGVKEDGVDITLEKNVLTIAGRVDTPDRKPYKLAHSEYEEGDYERSFVLSQGVDQDGIKATVRNGVLRLVLPKAREAVARKIPVKAG